MGEDGAVFGNRDAARPGTARPGGVVILVVVVAAALAAMVSIVVSALSEGNGYLAYGLPDPGAFTFFGVPVAATLAVIGAAVCVGSLLFAGFLVSPGGSGLLTAPAVRAVRRASWPAAVWFLSAGLAVPFVAAVELGEPVGQVISLSTLPSVIGSTELAQSWSGTAVIGFVLAVLTTVVRSWRGAVGLLAVALLGLVPLAVSGHSSAGGAHDLATASLLYHLAAVTLWVGGLIALLIAAAQRTELGPQLIVATTRFSRLALVCWLVMAGSGVLNALVRMPVTDLFDTLYGWLITAKIAALLGLGGFGFLQRRYSVRAVRRRASASNLLRLGAGEVLLMLATFGLAVGLAQTPPPTTATAPITISEVLIGYRLDGPPTFARLALDWRFDLIYGPLAIVLAAAYLLGVRRLRDTGENWPVRRTASWLTGCVILLLATSSGLGRYAAGMLSVHIGQTVLLSLWAPVFLALGAPITLALGTLSPGRDGGWGRREWLTAILDAPTLRFLTRPPVAGALFVAVLAGPYLTGLYDLALPSHWAGIAIDALALLTGFLLCWTAVGRDPAPSSARPVRRAGLGVTAALGAVVLGVGLFAGIPHVLGAAFYGSLGLPWVPSLATDQRLAGAVAVFGGGLLPLLVTGVAWVFRRKRGRRRTGSTA